MRTALVVLLFVIGLSAQRLWQTGRWDATASGREYILEGNDEFFTVEAVSGDAPVGAVAGTAVQYAVEGQALAVRGADGAERSWKVLGTTAKYSNVYTAVGGGHYITSVSADGSRVTLEDASRWDVDPRAQFSVAAWQPDDLITIRRSPESSGFPFSVSNTSRDDGAPARHLAR
jgi:hypothetical protein